MTAMGNMFDTMQKPYLFEIPHACSHVDVVLDLVDGVLLGLCHQDHDASRKVEFVCIVILGDLVEETTSFLLSILNVSNRGDVHVPPIFNQPSFRVGFMSLKCWLQKTQHTAIS